ncbi:hypothetical protein Bca101_038503 [Brassica carinata]
MISQFLDQSVPSKAHASWLCIEREEDDISILGSDWVVWIAVCSAKSSRYMVKSWLETMPRKIKTFQRFSRRYYSMYIRVVKLAHGIRNGAASVDGVDAKLWQSDAPLITSNDLVEADGFVFGFPTSSMLDQLAVKPGPVGGLWRTQQLAGKSAKIFYSTGFQGGDLETIE